MMSSKKKGKTTAMGKFRLLKYGTSARRPRLTKSTAIVRTHTQKKQNCHREEKGKKKPSKTKKQKAAEKRRDSRTGLRHCYNTWAGSKDHHIMRGGDNRQPIINPYTSTEPQGEARAGKYPPLRLGTENIMWGVTPFTVRHPTKNPGVDKF